MADRGRGPRSCPEMVDTGRRPWCGDGGIRRVPRRRADPHSRRSSLAHAVRGDRLCSRCIDDTGRLSLQNGERPATAHQRLQYQSGAPGCDDLGRHNRRRDHPGDELWCDCSEGRHRQPWWRRCAVEGLMGRGTGAHEPVDVSGVERLVPPLLSVIAGMVDVIGFLSLGLFTAHVTGNLVVIAAQLVHGGPPRVAQILAVPVFIVGVAAAWLIAKASDRRGPALRRPLLVTQFLLLAGVLMLSVAGGAGTNRHGLMAGVTAMTAVSAMALQFSLLHLAVTGAPSTAVMTGNLTNTVLALLDTLSRTQPVTEGASERLTRTVKLLVGFLAGCVAGAAAVLLLGEWAWSLPVVLAAVAVALR